MIKITQNKSGCTGCGSCRSVCPMRCISMEQDSEGFLYPIIDDKKCVKCHKCEKSCPSIVQGAVRKPLRTYAAKNPNKEIRYQSSSGGIFSLLAEQVISEGGVVFGVRFNDVWEVVHRHAETVEELSEFRGSKYVQSIVGDTYLQARGFLEEGRKVLYSGTPCQIAGLKAFLGKDYENFLTVDFVCHGVPSPLVWKKCLKEIISSLPSPPHTHNAHNEINANIFSILNIRFRDKIHGWNPILVFSILLTTENLMDIQRIINIKFRNKKNGWKHYDFTVASDDNTILLAQDSNRNSFMRGFLRDLYLRPSCHNCPARSLKSGSDITIGDYWGIGNVLPEFDDDKGVSLVMVNTEKGSKAYGLLDKEDRETTYADALVGNPSIEKSALPHKNRVLFFERLHKEPMTALIDKLVNDPMRAKLMESTSVLLSRLWLLGFAKRLLGKRRAKK